MSKRNAWAERYINAIHRFSPAQLHGAPRVESMLCGLQRDALRDRPDVPGMAVRLRSCGLLALQVGSSDGGLSLGHAELVCVLQRLGAIDLSLGAAVAMHNCLGLRPLLQFGPGALQQQALSMLTDASPFAAYARAAPDHRTDPAAPRTRAHRVAGGWRLRGVKYPVALAPRASLLTVLANACDTGGAALGPIALLVPADADGVVQEQPARTMGLRGLARNAVGFDNVFIPDAQVLLGAGEGMRVAQDAAAFARLGIGALCVGAIKRCAQMMVRSAGDREIATGRLLDNPVTCMQLHESWCAAWALEGLVDAIASGLDARGPMPWHACAALMCAGAELLVQAADRVQRLSGAAGDLEGDPAFRMACDARSLRLIEGAPEALTMELGTYAAPDSGAEHFIGHGLGCPELAAELGRLVTAARTRAGAARVFESDAAAIQWLDYRIGELSIHAVLLAAARWRARAEHGADADAAIGWAHARLVAAVRGIEAEQGGSRYAAPDVLRRRIDSFAAAIGTPEQPRGAADPATEGVK